MKKRVLFVIDSLHSGGAEKSLISLLWVFNHKQYDIDLFMFSPNGLYKSLLPGEVVVLDVPNSLQKLQQGFNNLLMNRNYKTLYVRLRKAIALRNPFLKNKMHTAQISWEWLSKGIENMDVNYDIAIAYSQGVPTYYVAEKVNAKKKLCWINTDYRLASFNKEYDRKYYEQYHHICAVSNYACDIFTKEMPIAKEKTSVVQDIISPAFIQSMANQQHEPIFKNYQGLRILTIGRLVEVKGYDMAIDACSMLKRKGFEFKWYAIGEGPLKRELADKIKRLGLEDTFILLGTYQHPYAFIKKSDIYVQPSRYEGYGMAVAEARTLNIPVVATRFDAVFNQLTDGENGLVVDMNAEAIYNGINRLILEKDLRKQIVNALKNEKKGNVEQIEKLYALLE